jgi:hypothetical protein
LSEVAEVLDGQACRRPWRVLAEATPQDEVLVAAGETAFLVHLTWTARTETPPWPTAERVDSAEAFERLLEFRY